MHLLSTLYCLKCGGIFASIHPEVIIVIIPKYANWKIISERALFQCKVQILHSIHALCLLKLMGLKKLHLKNRPRKVSPAYQIVAFYDSYIWKSIPLLRLFSLTLCSVSEYWYAVTPLLHNKVSLVIVCNTPSGAIVAQDRGLMNCIQKDDIKPRASALMSSLCSFHCLPRGSSAKVHWGIHLQSWKKYLPIVKRHHHAFCKT